MTLIQRQGPFLLLCVIVLISWQLMHMWLGTSAVVAPARAVAIAFDLLQDETVLPHATESLKAFVLAAIIAIVLGIGFGLVLGARPMAREVMEPIIMSLYSLPKVTLYPIALLIFGLGISAKIAFGALHGIFPILIFSMNAVHGTSPILLRSARAMRLSRWQTARHVLLPAALPQIFTGVRIGIALAFLGTLIGELFASQRGLGFLLIGAIHRNDIQLVSAIVLLITAFVLVLAGILLTIEKRLRHVT